ncbi:MAG: HAMP domain-containing histidine kinase [Tissierellia bacterium]|nr:HAMP domain-containing histidine kinase [Tissierellia bacterium]
MDKYKDLMIISILFFFLLMMSIWINPRFDILTLCLSLVLSILLFISLKKIRDSRLSTLNSKIDEMIETLHMVDERVEEVLYGDDIFGRLKDEIIKNLVEKREIASQAEDKRKNLKTYLEDITHQIKTPLTGILLMLDLIEEDPENKAKYIQIMRKDIDRLYSLADILLKMSFLDAGVMDLKKESFSAKNMLLDVEISLESYFSKDKMNIEIVGDDFNLIGDREWTLEAVINLVKNAIEASNGGKVQIELKKNKIFQSILVRDFSEGIPDSKLGKIYQRFYKADSKSKGFGIGLPMVKSIMDRQGGEVLYTRTNDSNYFELRFYR